MYKIDFNLPTHIHFIGIGGVSMSGLAKLLLHKGFIVSGSDWKESAFTEELTSLGAKIVIGPNKAENVPEGVAACIYTAAVHNDNEELKEAKRKHIPTLTRAELMGQLMANYKHAVGISGTHGKTTTTSLLSVILLEASLDPTISVGAVLPEINSNFRIGKGEHFVVESCEYTNSFLSFFPTDAVILNIEEDHLDFFKDINHIRDSFRLFCNLVPENGLTMINAEIPNAKELFKDAKCRIRYYGLCENGENPSDFDYAAVNISYDERGCGIFDAYEAGTFLGRVHMNILGRHNVSNALPAIAMALHYGIPFDVITAGISRFSGSSRRFEYKGELNGAKIYDDYAHHPSEIRTTLSSVKRNHTERVITVFQPHTFSRTKAFLEDFADSLSLSDVIVLADIYSAREIDDGTVSSGDIKTLIDKKGKECYHFHSFIEIENFLRRISQPNDLLITMGAGDVVNIGNSLVQK